MTESLIPQISKIIATFEGEIARRTDAWKLVRGAGAFREMEVEISTLARNLADRIFEKLLRAILLCGSFQQQTVEALRKTGRFRNGGVRTYTIDDTGRSMCSVLSAFVGSFDHGDQIDAAICCCGFSSDAQ